jgi:hypothetical protein
MCYRDQLVSKFVRVCFVNEFYESGSPTRCMRDRSSQWWQCLRVYLFNSTSISCHSIAFYTLRFPVNFGKARILFPNGSHNASRVFLPNKMIRIAHDSVVVIQNLLSKCLKLENLQHYANRLTRSALSYGISGVNGVIRAKRPCPQVRFMVKKRPCPQVRFMVKKRHNRLFAFIQCFCHLCHDSTK